MKILSRDFLWALAAFMLAGAAARLQLLGGFWWFLASIVPATAFMMIWGRKR